MTNQFTVYGYQLSMGYRFTVYSEALLTVNCQHTVNWQPLTANLTRGVL
jgi:hypothetical protein